MISGAFYRRAITMGVVPVLSVGFLAATTLGQPTWFDAANNRGIANDISDIYQHQNYNTDPNWENGGGWCLTTGLANSLYFFKKKGYNGLLPDAATVNATWLGTTSDELKSFSTFYFAGISVRTLLTAEGHGPRDGVRDGLQHTRIIENIAAGRMEYVSHDGMLKALPQVVNFDPTVFQVANRYLEDDRSVNLIIRADGAAVVDPANWWASNPAHPGAYHTLTLAGFDRTGNGRMYVSDPDSNKGNADANAGWDSSIRPDPAVGARRYVAGDPVPVAARGANPSDLPPNPARDSYYANLEMEPTDARLRTFRNVAANNRFRSLQVTSLEIIERAQADLLFTAPVAPPLTGGTSAVPAIELVTHGFEITAGLAKPVDQFWFFPSAPMNTDLGDPLFTASGGTWSMTGLINPGQSDPWGNPRDDGGFLISLTSGSPLLPGLGGTIGGLLANFEQTLIGWDIAFRDALETDVWRVQAFGSDLNNLPEQIPAPAAGVVFIGGIFAARRRR